ncbi:hypothetical protein LS68_009280 [Helicobacter sp. MIT 05-5293]|uniref:phage holin family protein n=1 Tax=unclassified Helicobacter TaxID=2593540 RepID=UPI0006917952|nr:MULTISPECIES: phage holin family protein [unclassified Helicobacter]TLD79852.1 hypothetical protein LS68_009280 [Helicobacter sp. MIT 05-5293]TLD85525.1 hypothetical protein LS69_009030 [Helicobacter sp. MIT 05-5294]
MDTLLYLFPNVEHYIELIPVACVGILSGIVNYFNLEEKKPSKLYALKIVCTSAFIALTAYTILSATDLPYLAKVGISAAIGFFGIDKALEYIQKIIALKNNGGMSDQDKKAQKAKERETPNPQSTKENE